MDALELLDETKEEKLTDDDVKGVAAGSDATDDRRVELTKTPELRNATAEKEIVIQN